MANEIQRLHLAGETGDVFLEDYNGLGIQQITAPFDVTSIQNAFNTGMFGFGNSVITDAGGGSFDLEFTGVLGNQNRNQLTILFSTDAVAFVTTEQEGSNLVPEAPVLDSVTPISGGLTISWTLGDEGGSEILHCNLYVDGVATEVEMPTVSINVTSLEPGFIRDVRVSAVNSFGESPLSNEARGTPSGTPSGSLLIRQPWAAYEFDFNSHDKVGGPSLNLIYGPTYLEGHEGRALSRFEAVLDPADEVPDISNATLCCWVLFPMNGGVTLEVKGNAPNTRLSVYFEPNFYMVNDATLAIDTTPPSDGWRAFAWRRTGASIELFIDGVSMGSAAYTSSNSDTKAIKALSGGSATTRLDRFIICDYSMTQDEIDAFASGKTYIELMTQGVDDPEPPASSPKQLIQTSNHRRGIRFF